MKQFQSLTFLVCFMILSCTKERAIFYYPNTRLADDMGNAFVYDFDQFKDLAELQDSLYRFPRHHPRKFPVFFIQDEHQDYYFAPSSTLEDLPPILKRKNEIGISNDSVWKNEVLFSIDHLGAILSKDLFNFNKDTLLAASPSKLQITLLHAEEKSITELKESLLTLFTTYNQIEKPDSIPLNIMMNETLIPEPFPEK